VTPTERDLLERVTDFLDNVVHDPILVEQGLSFEGVEQLLREAREALAS
jgi:hypothetical protein